MAIWCEIDEAAFDAWLATRPPIIQELGQRFRVNRLYRLTNSNHRCYPYSYSEDGTLTVVVDGQFNRVLFGRHVFGVKPENLVECDLPAPDEELGDMSVEAGYTDEDVENILIPQIRKDIAHVKRKERHAKKTKQ